MTNRNMIEVLPNMFVSRKDLKVHEDRMDQELKASKDGDTMSSKEEEEWEIADRIRSVICEK